MAQLGFNDVRGIIYATLRNLGGPVGGDWTTAEI